MKISRRRVTWWTHNIIVTPFIPIRIMLMMIVKAGEAAEWIGLRMPGWRMYDGWRGW